MQASYIRRDLHFIRPAVTSRGALTVKETYFIRLVDDAGTEAWGECALFRGLGSDDRPGYEAKVAEVCRAVSEGGATPDLDEWPSILFGLETAQASLAAGGDGRVFPSEWSRGEGEGIAINGLVWMDSPDRMEAAAMAKAEAGFRCIKFKIGACDFGAELRMLERVRRRFGGPERLEIRLDANGAWRDDSEALARLRALAPLDIHSLEQPVKARREELMQAVVAASPLAIALDEELIGRNPASAGELLDFIRPAYIILKPSLCGGFSGAERWTEAADRLGIGYWATSALESNVGLNAIAQWTARNGVPDMPQGLGTGALYLDNIPSPLTLAGERMHYDTSKTWGRP